MTARATGFVKSSRFLTERVVVSNASIVKGSVMTGLLSLPPPITPYPSPTHELPWNMVVVFAVSGQLLQQRFRILQVNRIKSFGEPVIHRGKHVMGFLAFALLVPELC